MCSPSNAVSIMRKPATLMHRRCGWCGVDLGSRLLVGREATDEWEMESSGMCDPCFEKMEREIEQHHAGKAA